MAQQTASAKKQTVTYEISVMQLKSEAQAKQLDSLMLKRPGIISSETIFTTKKLKVTVQPEINFHVLRAICKEAKLEITDANMVRTENN